MRLLRTLVHLSVTASLCAMFACTQSAPHNDSPEGALEKYVNIAFKASKVSDKQELLKLSAGEAEEWLSSMPDKTFEDQFMKNKMVLENLTTKDVRRENNGDVSLVYEIAFRDGSPDGKPTEPTVYTNKKIAYLTKVDNEWKIRATKNVKTYIERKDALEILPDMPPEPQDAKPQAKGK